jgi:hypothetical protein
LRPRRDIALVTGPIEHVEIVFDTLVADASSPGVLTEALFRATGHSTLLVAAEAYSRDVWRLYDESVVALAGLEVADRLDWLPERSRWRSARGPRA